MKDEVYQKIWYESIFLEKREMEKKVQSADSNI